MHRLYRYLLALLLCLPLATAADSPEEIHSKSQAALSRLTELHPDVWDLLRRAEGVLVFPDVVKMGFGVGGQYGEGYLLVRDEAVAYYATAGASFGLQLGAQVKSEVILFMTRDALDDFRNSQGWEVGVDGTVTVADAGAITGASTILKDEPVIGFIFSDKGLMGSLSFEGGKISRIAR